jgi:uncharacterized protein YydD (DUF2326 family)
MNKGTGCATEKRQSHVAEEISSLRETVKYLETEVSGLAERLASILRIEPANTTPTDKVDRSIVPLAENIREIRWGIANQASRIVELKNMCEL